MELLITYYCVTRLFLITGFVCNGLFNPDLENKSLPGLVIGLFIALPVILSPFTGDFFFALLISWLGDNALETFRNN